MVDKKPIMIEHKDWCSSGFSLVSDILNKDLKTFKTKICLQQEYKIKISDMKYNQIVSAVTDKLHKVSKIKRKSCNSQGVNIPMQCFVDISKIKNCQVCKHYITTTYSIPINQDKWTEYYPFLEAIDWKNIYTLPSKIVLDTYLICLQYKILHRVSACNYKLFVWKINDSPQCYICEEVDNLEHYFYYRTNTRYFWKQVEKWIQSIIPVTLHLTVLDVLFGIVNADPKYYYLLNYVILTAKYFIFTTRKQNESCFS